MRVTRLLNNHGIVFAPLNTAGLHFSEGATLYRFPERGGMVITRTPAPSQYDIQLSENEDFQGPLCTPPLASERVRLLDVPRSIDPRVRTLAAGIVRGVSDPRRRIEAIALYLTSHHHYSLSVEIGAGDPISNFLLQQKSAHCEYFASAAVILARLAGVPSRYVIGYLAHEHDGEHSTIVRQRDAHAWAECWITGTGWVVLDATPGDGRPDSLRDSPSPLARGLERFQDMLIALRLGAHTDSLVKFAAVATGGIMLAAATRLLWLFWKGRGNRGAPYVYDSSSLALAALRRDFERACRAYGLNCPSDQTWSEFLENAELSAVPTERIDLAREFVQQYNSARFGQELSLEQLKPLRLLLLRFTVGRTGHGRPPGAKRQ